jgi:hypothetical protein
MVLGIISVALFFVCVISVPAAIVGLILSIIGASRAGKVGKGLGRAVAGIVLSCLGIILVLPGLAFVIWFWKDLSSWTGGAYQQIRSGTADTDPNKLLSLWWWVTGG